MGAAMQDHILKTKGLSRRFGGFVAVDNVDLTIKRGDIHALIGPNGAGKTTCFNLITKMLQPSSGTINYDGQDITRAKADKVARDGLVRSFQISAVFPHLTSLENVRLALQRPTGLTFQFWRSDRVLRSYDAQAEDLLGQVGLSEYVHVPAVELSYGRKRALEIATTLALAPKLMLLDEPMAGMGREDISRVTDLIRKVAANRTILMVEHNLQVVATLSDRITVLQRGAVLAEGSYAEVSNDPDVLQAYIGAADV